MEFKDFEKALERLEKIVAELERGELQLEKGLKLFEEGVEISRFCNEKLKEAERRVEVLTRNARGEAIEIPFEPPEHGNPEGD